MLLQEQFGLFAANFVRWAAHWAKQLVRQANQALKDALTDVKTLVQDVAHCRARLVHHAVGRVLIFDEHSPYAGALLVLSGQVAFQPVLPFFKSSSFSRPETTSTPRPKWADRSDHEDLALVSPFERFGHRAVIVLDEGHHLGLQIGH